MRQPVSSPGLGCSPPSGERRIFDLGLAALRVWCPPELTALLLARERVELLCPSSLVSKEITPNSDGRGDKDNGLLFNNFKLRLELGMVLFNLFRLMLTVTPELAKHPRLLITSWM